MKTFAMLSILAIAAFGSIAAQAQTATIDHAAQEVWGPAPPVVVTTKVRQAVPATPATASTQVAKSRVEVQTELARARANGEMDFASAELNGSSPRVVPTTAVAGR